LLVITGTVHSHGAAGTHTHEGVDGHTWIDPLNAAEQADALLIAMCRAWPEHERSFAARIEPLRADLADLDLRVRRISPFVRSKLLVATHPAYGYLARRHEWTLHDVDMPPESAPSPSAIERLAALRMSASGMPAVILFEKPPCDAIDAWLRTQSGLTAVVFDPCETEPDGRAGPSDYLQVMRDNIDRLAAAVGARADNSENP
jgi:zinc transport system substrate-binding protein